MENQDSGVYNRSIHSGKWFLISVFAQKGINFVTFFILARLLHPRDYGVIGVVLLTQGILDQFTDPSFGEALTRKKDSIEPYLDPMWTFELIRRILIAIVLFAGAGLIGSFFHFQEMEVELLRWSGLLVVVMALGNVRQIYFAKELRFDKLFLRDAGSQIGFAVAAILYAVFVDASVWALFYGYLASYVVSFVLTYALYPTRPVFSFAFGRLRELIGYSKWVYGQGLLDALFAQSDRILIGRLLDPTSLGLYSKGKDLAATATAIMASLIAKVGFSAFAKVQDRMDKVREGFLKSIDVLIICALPLTLILLLEGGAIVSILLGVKWLGLVVPLKIFALGNLFIAFVRIVNPLLSALGRPDVNFKTNALQLIVSIPLMIVGFAWYGMNGLAAAVVTTWILLLLYVIKQARPILQIPVRAFVPVITSGFSASLVVLIVDILFRSWVHSLQSPVADSLLIAVLGFFYFVCLWLVSRRYPHGPWATFESIRSALVAKKSFH